MEFVRYIGVLLKSILGFEMWASMLLGHIIECGHLGRLISWLREVSIPRDPILPPSQLYPYPG